MWKNYKLPQLEFNSLGFHPQKITCIPIIIFYSIIGNMQYHRKEQLIIPFTLIFELLLKNSVPLSTSLFIFYWNSRILGFWCIISECYNPKLTNKPRLLVRYFIIKLVLVFNTGDKVHVLFFIRQYHFYYHVHDQAY